MTLLLVAADALTFMQYSGLTSWLLTFFNKVRGMSLTQAGFITGLLPFVGIFAVLAGGALGMRYTGTRLFFIIPGLLVGLGGLGTFFFGNTAIICLAVIMLGVGSWSFTPKLLSLPMELVITQQKVGVVRSTSVTVSGNGMFMSLIVIGGLRNATGSFVPGFLIFAVGAWFCSLLDSSSQRTNLAGQVDDIVAGAYHPPNSPRWTDRTTTQVEVACDD